jgi:hypothetical protein
MYVDGVRKPVNREQIAIKRGSLQSVQFGLAAVCSEHPNGSCPVVQCRSVRLIGKVKKKLWFHDSK